MVLIGHAKHLLKILIFVNVFVCCVSGVYAMRKVLNRTPNETPEINNTQLQRGFALRAANQSPQGLMPENPIFLKEESMGLVLIPVEHKDEVLIHLMDSSNKTLQKYYVPVQGFSLEPALLDAMVAAGMPARPVYILSKVEEKVMNAMIRRDYQTAEALCVECNLDFLPFICQRLADVTFSVDARTAQFGFCQNLRKKTQFAPFFSVASEVRLIKLFLDDDSSIFVRRNVFCLVDPNDPSYGAAYNSPNKIEERNRLENTFVFDARNNPRAENTVKSSNYCCRYKDIEEVRELISLLSRHHGSFDSFEFFLRVTGCLD